MLVAHLKQPAVPAAQAAYLHSYLHVYKFLVLQFVVPSSVQRRQVSLESHLEQPGIVAVHNVQVVPSVSKNEPYAQTTAPAVELAGFTVHVFGLAAASLVYPV